MLHFPPPFSFYLVVKFCSPPQTQSILLSRRQNLRCFLIILLITAQTWVSFVVLVSSVPLYYELGHIVYQGISNHNISTTSRTVFLQLFELPLVLRWHILIKRSRIRRISRFTCSYSLRWSSFISHPTIHEAFKVLFLFHFRCSFTQAQICSTDE